MDDLEKTKSHEIYQEDMDSDSEAIDNVLNITLIVKGAEKRGISPKQFFDLLKIAEELEEDREEWIDKKFEFNGDGTIKAKGDLDLYGCTGLKSLPENLEVENLNLENCISLESLPKSLDVYGNLNLEGCVLLESLGENISGIENLNLRGCISLKSLPGSLDVWKDLDLTNCTSLKSLPEDLNVGGNLVLAGCTSLISIPQNLKVRKKIVLSTDLKKEIRLKALNQLHRNQISWIITNSRGFNPDCHGRGNAYKISI